MSASEPLALAHQGRIDGALRRLADGVGEHALSDLSFANLYLFRAAHDYRFAGGDWPHITGHTYDGTRHVLPLFDPASMPIDALRALLAEHGCLYPLTPAQVERLDSAHFVASDARDDADYLYPADHFRHYRGALLQKKANLMRQLLAEHTLHSEPYTPALREAALAVLDGWMADKGHAPGAADHGPCSEALRLSAQLGLQGFMHWADGQPAGFVLAEELQPGVFALRFAKGLARCKGIAQYMFHHFCTHLPRPVAWLNFEQDLGLPNFRQTKLSYDPQLLLRKVRVRLRDAANS